MSVHIEASAPPIREDGLPHHVESGPTGWRCFDDCPSCTAAGYFLDGPTEQGETQRRDEQVAKHIADAERLIARADQHAADGFHDGDTAAAWIAARCYTAGAAHAALATALAQQAATNPE